MKNYETKKLSPRERMESLADRNKASETDELKRIYREFKEDEYSNKQNKSFSTRRR